MGASSLMASEGTVGTAASAIAITPIRVYLWNHDLLHLRDPAAGTSLVLRGPCVRLSPAAPSVNRICFIVRIQIMDVRTIALNPLAVFEALLHYPSWKSEHTTPRIH